MNGAADQVLTASLARDFKKVAPIDVSDTSRGYVLIANNGAAVRISSSALLLIRAVDAGVPFDVLAGWAATLDKPPLSPETIKCRHEQLVQDLVRLGRPTAPLRPPRGFCLRLAIVPGATVRAAAGLFTGLFRLHVAAAAVFVIACALAATWRVSHSFSISQVDFLLAYGLFVLSLAFHEIGHAAAAVYCDTSPGEVGVALYLIYPVFYTDVTESWRLRRPHRVLVDISGVYFQLLSASIWIACFYATGSRIFYIAYLMTLYSALFSLNPLLKFDGYWTVADLFGIANLSRQPRRLWTAVIDRVLRGRRVYMPWTTGAMYVIAAYSIASSLFWVVVLLRFGPSFWRRLTEVGSLVRHVLAPLADGQLPAFSDLRALLLTTFLIATGTVMIRNLTTTARSKLAKSWRNTPLRSPAVKSR